MKKKLLSILLIGVLVVGLTGCGNSGTKNYKNLNYSTLTVYNKNTNETEYLTLNELTKINQSNSAKFKQNYEYSSIKLVGKITKIKSETNYAPVLDYGEVDLITLGDEEDFRKSITIILPTGKFDLASLNVGDLLYVESGILFSNYEDDLTLMGTEDSKLSINSINNTKIEVVNDKSNKEIEEMLK